MNNAVVLITLFFNLALNAMDLANNQGASATEQADIILVPDNNIPEEPERVARAVFSLKRLRQDDNNDVDRKKRKIICEVCQTPVFNLKSHMSIHTGERPYKCDFEGCGQACITSSHLKKHMRVHTGERPYKCDFESCGQAFTQLGNLKTHMLIHTGERPYQCEIEGCSQAFTILGNLKRHMRVHTGERPYQCDFEGCGQAFTTSGSLKRHINRKHKQVQEEEDEE